jgi:hypothetical protein
MKLYIQNHVDLSENTDYQLAIEIKKLKIDIQDLIQKNMRKVKKEMNLIEIENILSENIDSYIESTTNAIRSMDLDIKKEQIAETLRQVQVLLNDVNQHYSDDNITKRDAWMQWVNERAVVYDASVEELMALKDALSSNNALTLDLYININRNRIIDFASKIVNDTLVVSREEFNRIFKTYHDYEEILKKHNKTNGEVDIAMSIIKDSYTTHMKNHSFVEDVRGY